jgi:arylsulfatase
MNAMKRTTLFLISIVSAVLVAVPATAQQITGTPGSPSATTTLQGDQIPPPPPRFGGKIERNATQSKPYWPPRVEPRKGAPNVLLIITDDTGYGTPSTFGGVVPTPHLDRVAREGLRYTNFHSTALCSPTRAALITGRNHHSAGFGVISEQSSGYPGYNSIIARDKATIGRILKDNGYRTSWFGKTTTCRRSRQARTGRSTSGRPAWVSSTSTASSAATPTSGRRTCSGTPRRSTRSSARPGWNLTTAMADDAIAYMNRINALAPDQPFFIKYAPGGVHAPHHPTPSGSRRSAS